MSRDRYEGWDSPARSRDSGSGPRSHRRRGSGYGDDRGPADDEYGADPYADRSDYGTHRYAAPDGYGADGYSDQQGGYGQDRYGSDGGQAAQGYEGGGYANGYGGGGYADDGYGGDERNSYAGQDPYASRDPYSTGDYGPADPYAAPDPRTSGSHSVVRGGRDPYDSAGGGYASPAGYADGAGYADSGYGGGQDGFAGQEAFASPAGAGYDRGGYEEQDEDLYRWREPQGTGGRRGSREGDFDAEDPRHDGFFRGFGGGDDHGGRNRRPPSRGRPPKEHKSHAGLIALGIVLAIFAGIGYTGYHYYSAYKAKHASYVGAGYGSTTILVNQGDTLDSISSQLLHKGVILAIDPWASYVANKSGLQPGKYKIHIHMSPAATYAALTNPKNVIVTKVTIPDGMRVADALPLMARESGLPLSQFQAAIKNTAALGLPSYANGNPEGYLYPDTYDLAPGETALKILQNAVAQFNHEATVINLTAAAAHVQYTPAQIITGASLLEAEARSQYFGNVARVIDNRINQGMPLQFDSTVAYALNKHTDQLTTADKQVNSPYNTFLNKDLPPGPIDSPDAAAIQAFLQPPHGDWIYFITVDKSGTTDFTSSYSQFQTWMAQARANGV